MSASPPGGSPLHSASSDAASANAWFALPDHGVLSLTGRDALAFAQAQCMNDVQALADGHWQWNGWLSPKGRVIALFALLRVDEETLWLLVPDMPAGELAERLRRFVFRSKVTLAVREDLRVCGTFARSRLASGDHAVGDATTGFELDLAGHGDAEDDGARALRIVPAAELAATRDDAAVTRWAGLDLIHGLPRLDATQRETWTPQQLSLDRLRAFSVKKGCYPGQEIVARTHFLGQAKRGLVLLRDATGLQPGETLRSGDDTYGTVVSAAGDVALAVAGLEDPRGEGIGDSGAHWRRARLVEGLAR